jgi:beta-glucanase (GH16 family)
MQVHRREPVSWVPVWSDEFDQAGPPNPKLWKFQVRPPYVVEALGLVERQHFAPAQFGNARVAGGQLQIEARKESLPGVAYSSACLVSRETLQYGRILVRAKLPTGRGIWPAIWLIPPNGEATGWPDCGEIDLMEHFGALPGKIHVNVNTKAASIATGNSPGRWLPLTDLASAFHVYGLEWSTDRLELFIDDQSVLTYEKTSGDSAQWPFDRPFELRLQLGVGGITELGTEVDDSLLPQRLLVDYVRVYRRHHEAASPAREPRGRRCRTDARRPP